MYLNSHPYSPLYSGSDYTNWFIDDMNKVYEEKGEIVIPDDCYELPVYNKRGFNLQINMPTFNAKWLKG